MARIAIGHASIAREHAIQYRGKARLDRATHEHLVRACERLRRRALGVRLRGEDALQLGGKQRGRRSFSCDVAQLASLRYDLSKLRAKGLVERVPHSRRYRLLPHGYSICLLFLKLFERVYAPLTAGLLDPSPPKRVLPRRSAIGSTVCISASSLTSMRSSRPSA